jgi:hypothetical protein
MFAAFTALMIALVALVLAVILPVLVIAWVRNVCTDSARDAESLSVRGLFPARPTPKAPRTIIGQPAFRVLPRATIKVGG